MAEMTVPQMAKTLGVSRADVCSYSQGDDKVSSITCEVLFLEPILWNGTPAKKNDNTLRT